MPKMKTNKGAAKRFRVKKSGAVKYKKSNLRHMLTGESTKSKRQNRPKGHLAPSESVKIAQLLPYG